LLRGFNLVGLRVYETLLGLKYLRSRPEVDPDRVGLIGHSGGSSASNLTVRLESAVRAYVSDCAVDWFKSSDFELYHCETAPALFPYHEVINDFATAPVPVKAVPYGYPNGMAEIFDFFDQHL
jgi:dipeptidyl aminopeptidase/acylaminoacyl peptidase